LPRTCDNCGRPVPKKETMFSLRIEMFAEAGPIEIDIEELEGDHMAMMEQLIEHLEDVDPEEAADEVYEEYTFLVCNRCRRYMHRGFKERARSKK
jgi:hypothetical protein